MINDSDDNGLGNPSIPLPQANDETHTSQESVAWTSGGKIFVKTLNEAATVKIVPCSELQLYINGIHVTTQVEVSENDVIEIAYPSYREQGLLRVHVSPDKMTAFLEIKPDYINTFELEDSKPSSLLVLRAKQIKRASFSETKDTLLSLLSKNNISFGIDFDALDQLINQPSGGMVLVAKGLPPTPPTDDHVEIIFQKNNSESHDSMEIVDFKELHSIPSVTAREILARKVLGKEGQPGKTVLGQDIKPKEPKRLNLLASSGAQIEDDGLKAISTSEGLPRAKMSGTNCVITVDPVLKIPGDVTVKTGNIRFKGDITIFGSVENNMSVSTSGNITILKILTKCKITAGGNVTVKGNIVNSEIISGGFIVICNAIKPLLQELFTILEDLHLSGTVMFDKLPPNSKINYGNVLGLLIEKRFIKFNGILDKLFRKFKELDMKLLGKFEARLHKAIYSLTGINLLQFLTPSHFQDTVNEIESFLNYADNLERQRSVVSISVILNSVIKSSGDVFVQGSGCFNTQIYADGNVRVEGVVRGGIIEAKDDIYIKELGSELGSKSLVIVPKDKRIRVDNAYDGVTFQIGKMTKILERKMSKIEVSLNEEGYLQIKNY